MTPPIQTCCTLVSFSDNTLKVGTKIRRVRFVTCVLVQRAAPEAVKTVNIVPTEESTYVIHVLYCLVCSILLSVTLGTDVTVLLSGHQCLSCELTSFLSCVDPLLSSFFFFQDLQQSKCKG